MKRINLKNIPKWGVLMSLAVSILFAACNKTQDLDTSSVTSARATTTDAATLEKLKAYKSSKHQLMAAYFRTWRDLATDPSTNKTSMKELPDSLDIAIVFPNFTPEGNAFWDSLTNVYVPHFHARGTKVIRTVGVKTLLDTNYPNTDAGYESLAQSIIAKNITPYNLDGLDVDVEQSFTTTEDKQRVVGVFKALSKYLGPKSGTGKLLVYDTNQDGNTATFTATYDLYDYVLIQSYGRSVSGLQTTYNTYASRISPDKYLIGFSFYEENGTYWSDVTLPLNTSKAYKYATWQPTQGTKGGIFSYAVDRDGVTQGNNTLVPTHYDVTRLLISTMNPPK